MPKNTNLWIKSAQNAEKCLKGGISEYWQYYPHTPRESVSPVCAILVVVSVSDGKDPLVRISFVKSSKDFLIFANFVIVVSVTVQ